MVELPGRRGITPAFGYTAPHPSGRGTSTLRIKTLPSTHYGPLRLPPRPGLSLASVPSVVRCDRRGGSPVLPGRPPCRVPSSLPRRDRRGPIGHDLAGVGLPLSSGGSAPATGVFGACSTFTHVMARRLAERPEAAL